MALTYTELTSLVRQWSNRDEEVVSDSVIQDTLFYYINDIKSTYQYRCRS